MKLIPDSLAIACTSINITEQSPHVVNWPHVMMIDRVFTVQYIMDYAWYQCFAGVTCSEQEQGDILQQLYKQHCRNIHQQQEVLHSQTLSLHLTQYSAGWTPAGLKPHPLSSLPTSNGPVYTEAPSKEVDTIGDHRYWEVLTHLRQTGLSAYNHNQLTIATSVWT